MKADALARQTLAQFGVLDADMRMERLTQFWTNHFAVSIGVEAVEHHAVVAAEFAIGLHRGRRERVECRRRAQSRYRLREPARQLLGVRSRHLHVGGNEFEDDGVCAVA